MTSSWMSARLCSRRTQLQNLSSSETTNLPASIVGGSSAAPPTVSVTLNRWSLDDLNENLDMYFDANFIDELLMYLL